MPILSDTIVVVALIAVFAVLVLGLWNMMRGGSPSRSQNLMRWRVGLQFLAIIVVMAVIWIAG
jgi:FtsZ-interacting cell division protein ZipA